MKPKLLFHVCCAPCSGLLSRQLRESYDIAALFDNPNIWPEEEFDKRANEAEKFFRREGVEFILAPWRHDKWLEISAGREADPERGERCRLCYGYRLRRAAEYAKEHGFDVFTTSLSFSPYKDSDAVHQLGRDLAEEFSVRFLDDDFRLANNWQKAVEFSKSQAFYRQKYCGCEFSLPLKSAQTDSLPNSN